ncbi:HDL058Wp [Eremothecium sinecaudum]|uniref:Ammonium transporter n=1 Tax=Eremothecium sinecaudum TaxID=45286 RepID=A0A120K279_9SACH|nr:HDL058Wp [Eremothecium sinecaudum]AMD20686.1 HDL058Wp [Eremothecium sinecaudum]
MAYVWEESYDAATVGFIFLGAVLVFIMIPGLGFLYSGLARRKSALSLIWAVLVSCIVGLVQWYLLGYSLAFSSTAPNNKVIGNFRSVALSNVYGKVDPTDEFPELAWAIFQGLFMCVTLAIIAGTVAERGRLLPAMVFFFLFSTFVYCPVTYWVWAPGGWAYQWEVLDWAGGGPVEILSAVGGFVYSYFLGRRRDTELVNYRPHNVSMVALGTYLLWFGWLGFNGCTALSPNLRAIYALMNTFISAATGGMAWCVLDYRLERKWSTVGMCSGIISGLVASTPSSGCITLYASLIQGIASGIICNLSTKLKYYAKVDDAMDILAEHGIAGIVGLIFNAIFAADWVIGMDGSSMHDGGWITHNWKQAYKQLAYIVAVTCYSTVVTSAICYIINKIPGLKLRCSEIAEERGMDEDQIGEFAYDYVEVRRDYYAWKNKSDED